MLRMTLCLETPKVRDDIHLAAGTLADQLGSEHPKRLAVGLVCDERLADAPQKYVHRPFLAHDTDYKSLMRVAPSAMSGNNAWGNGTFPPGTVALEAIS